MHHDVTSPAHCEVEFANWGPTRDGFLFFDRALVDVGMDLELRVAAVPIFAGAITVVEAHFPADRIPSLILRAQAPALAPVEAGGATIALRQGNELLDFVVTADTAGGEGRLVGAGTATMHPDLRPGATVTLGGLGALLSGDFAITAVTHRFDLTEGGRTELAVQRG